MRFRVARERRGVTMLFVVLVLALLTLMVAAYFSQASDHVLTAKSVAGQQVALSNAQRGLGEAVRQIRSGVISLPVTGLPFCPTPQVDLDPYACPPTTRMPDTAPLPIINNGAGSELNQGGGLAYRFVVFRRPDVGAPANRYRIRVTGYYGYNENSANLITSELEAEIDVGGGTQFRCDENSGYGCF